MEGPRFCQNPTRFKQFEPVFEHNKPALQKSPPLITHENGKNGPLFCNKKIKVGFFANER